MDILSVAAPVLGGVGLFLLGMWQMTAGLTLAAGDALRVILRGAVREGFRGIAVGVVITAIVQSSSAIIVATIGFINAGLLTLSQAVWLVFGTNVGTTMTGWLVALVGVKVDVAALAMPLVGAGMLLRLMASARPRLAASGQAIAGFGVFFLGIGALQSGFSALPADHLAALSDADTWPARIGALALGVALTAVMQSSSAAMAVLLTASLGSGIPLPLAAAAVVGTNIGTTSTGVLAAIGATPAAKRVALAHIGFNILTGLVALAAMPLLLAGVLHVAREAGVGDDEPTILALFHTAFNLLGVLILWPLTPSLVRLLSARFVSLSEDVARPRYLDESVMSVPALAVRSLTLEILNMAGQAMSVAAARIAEPYHGRERNAEMQTGLLALGARIREFIVAQSPAEMAPERAAVLPDLLRAVQHLDDLLKRSADQPSDPSWPLPDAMRGRAEHLRKLTLETLTPPVPGEAHNAELDRTLMEAVEAEYQGLKADLLAAAATGALPVHPMEAHLLIAQYLRRCADSAVKTRRRLGPHLGELVPEPKADGVRSSNEAAAG